MAKTSPRERGKLEALRQQGTLNLHPEEVTDSRFQEDEFFDPRDLVQVKYLPGRPVADPEVERP
jgi:hypothetical protein